MNKSLSNMQNINKSKNYPSVSTELLAEQIASFSDIDSIIITMYSRNKYSMALVLEDQTRINIVTSREAQKFNRTSSCTIKFYKNANVILDIASKIKEASWRKTEIIIETMLSESL